MNKYFKSYINRNYSVWLAMVKEKSFVSIFLALTFSSLFLLFISPPFMKFIQFRHGIEVFDPILNIIPAKDVSIYIMLVMNITSITTLIWLSQNPSYFIKALLAFNICLVFRYSCILLFPLEAPNGFIPLKDPFLENIVYDNFLITKDLFFSGHTAFMFLAFLVMGQRWIKVWNFIAFLIIATLVLVQHIHYSYDVFAAPFFAFLSYFLAEKFLEKREIEWL